MKGISMWLYSVAALRLLSVVIGVARVDAFRLMVYPLAPEEVTPLVGRVFATWTLTTCALCVCCARTGGDPQSSVFAATLFSFFTALAHYVSELVVFNTVTVRTAASPLVVASISIVWMLAVFYRRTKQTVMMHEGKARQD
jgi:hypothetical protein